MLSIILGQPNILIMKEKYVIAISIVLSTIIYVFGNRYFYIQPTSKVKMGVFDKFTGKTYFASGYNDLVDGTTTKRELKEGD